MNPSLVSLVRTFDALPENVRIAKDQFISELNSIPDYFEIDKDRVIREINSLGDIIEINKKDAIKKLFEERKNNNVFVRNVMEGKTTFPAEYDKLLQPYESKVWLGYYRLPDNFRESVADLEDCIGISELDSKFNKYFNLPNTTVGFAAYLFLMSAIPDYRRQKRKAERDRKEFNRREFIKRSVGLLGGGALIGATAGSAFSFSRWSHLNQLRGNAQYLQDMYEKYVK